ncbi:uncharacterized protein LOC100883035 isoform X2 [Megachile rotundata]|uniref:uncharacterized protein LOC100883035 isoform X2 n=1 Tax=Megachile rotundata TaxID=143995 RepID=UPI003FD15FA5
MKPDMHKTFYTFLLFLFTATAKRNAMFVPKSESWISNDNFSRIIKLSLPNSRCCNVFLSDSIEDLEVLFRQFRSIYPYEYLLKRNECDGYFLLGSSDTDVMELISKISSLQPQTEVLIIINSIVSNDSSIFNSSLYRDADVNIVSMSGIWKLSENYLKPRIFTKLEREMQVCSIFRPPMTYFNRTVNKTIDGVLTEVFITDRDLDKDGVEMQLFLIMAEKLNFTWSIRKPKGNFKYGRRVNETVWKGGMIEMLHKKQVDMAFGSIWLTHDQYKFINLSEAWYQVYLHFLVPRPRRTTSFWALARPFSTNVWYLLVSVIITHSLYTWTRAWIDPKYPKRFRNFLITLTDLIGYLLSSTVPKTIANNKLQILLWQTAGWLIITAYCSSLAASLAGSEYEPRIDTIKQFLDANLWWGEEGPPPFRDYFDLMDPYAAQLPSRYINTENSTQTEALIKRGNFAIIGKIIDTCFFPENNVTNEDLKNYRLMRHSVGHHYAAFAVQPWLLVPVNRLILWLRETGITIWHLRNVIRKRNNYNLRKVLVEQDGYDGSTQVLGLTPLGAGFSLLLVGLSMSMLVFYLELKYAARKSNSIRDILRDIDKKR